MSAHPYTIEVFDSNVALADTSNRPFCGGDSRTCSPLQWEYGVIQAFEFDVQSKATAVWPPVRAYHNHMGGNRIAARDVWHWLHAAFGPTMLMNKQIWGNITEGDVPQSGVRPCVVRSLACLMIGCTVMPRPMSMRALRPDATYQM